MVDESARRRGTIRFRITLVATTVFAVVLAATSVLLVVVQRSQLTASLDASLEQRASDLAALIGGSDGVPTVLPNRDDEDSFAQLVDGDGAVVAASANLGGAGPVAPRPPDREALSTFDVSLPAETETFRVLSQRVNVEGVEAVLHVGVTIDDVNDATGALTLALAIAVPLAMAVLALVSWWLVGRTLAPVEVIRREVEAIGEGMLDRRVPAPPVDDEIARLATTMNHMLDRIETSVARQQRFVADASHELRSPLTRIRTQLEVEASSGGGAGLETVESLLDETVALQRLVEDLLHLARADAGAFEERREPIDLDDVVLRAARRLRANGRVRVDTAGVSGAHVVGDPDQLTRVVRNLADNAERHAATTVSFMLGESDGFAVLRVTDDGPGIPPGERETLFERFARGDEARTREAGGAGLGLAIAQEIVGRHGGRLELDDAAGRGTSFVVRLPSPE
jgi:signal transduction histidine kinase